MSTEIRACSNDDCDCTWTCVVNAAPDNCPDCGAPSTAKLRTLTEKAGEDK